MTIDLERLRAIDNVRDFFNKYLQYKGRIRKTELYKDIYDLYRHFPEEWWVDFIKEYIFMKDATLKEFFDFCGKHSQYIRPDITLENFARIFINERNSEFK